MPDNGAYVQIEQRTLETIRRRPARLRAIAEDVNEGRPGWDIISDRDMAGILGGLHRRGLVEQIEAGYWQTTNNDWARP